MRRQIEEKQRKKEEEKKREEDLKKKELEEYLTIHYKGDLPAHVQKQLKPPDNRKEDRRNNDDREHERRDNPPRRRPVDKSCRDEQDDDDEPNDYRRKPDKTTNRRDPAEEFSDYDRRRDNYDDVRGSMEYDDDEPPSYGNKHKKLSEKGRRGKQDREFYDDQSSDPSDNFSSDRRYQENDYDSPKRKGKAKQKKKGIADELDDYGEKKWVSMKEYDELSQLCDKLLNQQDKLQSEIQKQAELIKVNNYSCD